MLVHSRLPRLDTERRDGCSRVTRLAKDRYRQRDTSVNIPYCHFTVTFLRCVRCVWGKSETLTVWQHSQQQQPSWVEYTVESRWQSGCVSLQRRRAAAAHSSGRLRLLLSYGPMLSDCSRRDPFILTKLHTFVTVCLCFTPCSWNMKCPLVRKLRIDKLEINHLRPAPCNM